MNEYELFNTNSIDIDELIDKAKVALRNKSPEYKNLLDKVSDIKINYPNLQMISEDNDDISLTKTDCKMLQKLFDLELDIRNFERVI